MLVRGLIRTNAELFAAKALLRVRGKYLRAKRISLTSEKKRYFTHSQIAKLRVFAY